MVLKRIPPHHNAISRAGNIQKEETQRDTETKRAQAKESDIRRQREMKERVVKPRE